VRITTSGRYALRASLALARLKKDGQPISVSALAEDEEIPLVFLEQIFFKLRKAGLVSAVRGPGGGFYFAKPLEKLTVKQIFDAAGENLDVTFCNKRSDNCKRANTCVTHHVLTNAQELVNNYFEGITLASLIKNKGGQFV